ncbi:Gfo/Idh/MocA family protein [Candidatus Puniceispirillum sp.]|uniref:Gfo/Idh/MocA family protein n=2 Tax=Candidatus Puniceispirillum TaxID=767891 RepID=UPI001EBD57A4|nr:Gfo/Idh/MocA family oxidoreductase [Candidatus Puniceispirillum sp.]
MTNIGLIGCGMWGRNLARNLLALDALACVTDSTPANATAFAAEFNAPPASFDDLCHDSSLDGVVISTPAHSHANIAVPLLAAGKHVYIEKPLALTMDDATRIAAAANDHNRQVMVGHLIRYHASFIELQKQLAAGVIGDLRHIQATRLAMGRIRNTESVLFDLCPHDLSLVLALTGTSPTHVSCAGASHVTPGIVDVLSTVLGFDGGISAHLNTGWINPIKQHCLTVIGSTGSLVFDDTKPWDEKLTLFTDDIRQDGDYFTITRQPPKPLTLTQGEPLKDEMRAFIHSCKSGTPALTDMKDALTVQAVLEDMQRQLVDMTDVKS